MQRTGLLSDFFLFGSPTAPAVQEARSSFQSALAAGPLPSCLVITDTLHLHPEDPGHWAKLQKWPWFTAWLQDHYTLVLTRESTHPALWWARPQWPAAYRLYVRNDRAATAALSLSPGTGSRPPAPITLPEP